jgi:putative GTP pyrophosphokinase
MRQHKGLPDQDVVSALYADRIMQLDPYVYNMTERMLHKDSNLLRKVDFDWIFHNAAIIHYCGPNKPWNENYAGKLDIFYLEIREEMHDRLSAPAIEKTRSIEREITQQETGPFIENARLFTTLMTQYRCAMMMVETKLRILYEEFAMRHDRNPFDTICTRLKRPASILEKLQRLGLPTTVQSIEENLNDIAGVRVVCRFQEDIYALSHMLEQQDDVILVRRKDYIRNPKPNGYRSLHLIIKVPVFFSNEKKYINVEVQFRTLAMNFWACLEHELKYKKNIENPGAIAAELKECAELINNIDNWMQRIRTTIDSCLQSSSQADTPMEVELPPEPPKSPKPESIF